MISSTRKAVLLLIATFILGALTGAAGMAVAERKSESLPRDRRTEYLEHLTRTLGLSGTQRDSVGAVLDRYRPTMDTLMQEIRPRLDTVRAAMRVEIAKHLSPKQQKEYEEMQQQRDRERKDGGHGPR
jgi:hypothetical protein